MASGVKRLAWIGVALGLVALTAGGLNLLGDNACRTTVFSEVPSPSGRLKAVLLERDCGATTGFNRQVQILAADEAPRRDSPFVMDGDHGRATLDVQLHWATSARLTIRHDPLARVFNADTQLEGVSISYTHLPK